MEDQTDYINTVRRKLVKEKPQVNKSGLSRLTGDKRKLLETVPSQYSFKKKNKKFTEKS